MSKTKAGPVSGERIKSFVERVEKLMEERKAIGGDIRDVFAEAKGVGYDVRTMRKLIQIRALDAADRAEQETLLDVYMHAVGMEGSNLTIMPPSEEELEERAGRIIAEVDRCMALVIDAKPPKIEAIKDLIGCSTGKAHKLRGFVTARLSQSNSFHRENENPPALTAEEEEALWQEFRRDDDAEALDLAQNEVQQSRGGGVLCPLCLQDEHDPDCANKPIFAESANNESCGSRESRPAEPSLGGETVGYGDGLRLPYTASDGAGVATRPHDTHPTCAENAPVPASGTEAGAGNGGGGDDERRLTPEPEVARVAPPATPPISDAQALANLEEVEAAFFLRRDSTRVVA